MADEKVTLAAAKLIANRIITQFIGTTPEFRLLSLSEVGDGESEDAIENLAKVQAKLIRAVANQMLIQVVDADSDEAMQKIKDSWNNKL